LLFPPLHLHAQTQTLTLALTTAAWPFGYHPQRSELMQRCNGKAVSVVVCSDLMSRGFRDLLEQYPEMTFDYPEKVVPHFMIGAGCGLTRKFLNCSLEHLATIPLHPLEDIYTGLLRERCGQKWRWDIGGDVRQTNLTGYVLSHKVTNEVRERMRRRYAFKNFPDEI
jgi:hypothetical protein